MINIKEINQDQLSRLFHEDLMYDGGDIEEELLSWELEDEDDSDEGKYSLKYKVFSTPEGKCYKVSVTRSGNYHSGYDWHDYEIQRVYPKLIQSTYWSINP